MAATDTNARQTADTDRRDGAKPHTTPSARLVNHGRTLHVPGAQLELLTPLAAADELPCLLRATIPGGGVVALHSHADPETFVVVAGELDGLTRYAHGSAWVPLHAGDIFHVPGTRTTGNGAGHFGLTAPGWEGKLPDGVQRVQAPTPRSSPHARTSRAATGTGRPRRRRTQRSDCGWLRSPEQAQSSGGAMPRVGCITADRATAPAGTPRRVGQDCRKASRSA